MSYMEYWKELQNSIDSLDHQKIYLAQSMIVECAKRGNTIFTAGNGGSASTAEHASCDIGKGMSIKTERKFPVISLMSNLSLNSAWSNDESYEEALAKILQSLGKKKDLIILISGSGNSRNILNAAQIAKDLEIMIIAMTGFDGGKLAKYADLEIRTQSNDMQIVENMHLAILHSMLKI